MNGTNELMKVDLKYSKFQKLVEVYLLLIQYAQRYRQETRFTSKSQVLKNDNKASYNVRQQIYRRTTMPKCDFKKVALQLYWNRILAWVFSCTFAAYFQKTFPMNTSGGLLLKNIFKASNIISVNAILMSIF